MRSMGVSLWGLRGNMHHPQAGFWTQILLPAVQTHETWLQGRLAAGL